MLIPGLAARRKALLRCGSSYGPYSRQIAADLSRLKLQRLLTSFQALGRNWDYYSLTEQGKEKASELKHTLNPKALAYLHRVRNALICVVKTNIRHRVTIGFFMILVLSCCLILGSRTFIRLAAPIIYIGFALNATSSSYCGSVNIQHSRRCLSLGRSVSWISTRGDNPHVRRF